MLILYDVQLKRDRIKRNQKCPAKWRKKNIKVLPTTAIHSK